LTFYYKGISSNLTFGQTTIELFPKIIDSIYVYFGIINFFPKFEIIIHPKFQNEPNTLPDTINGFIRLCTNKCANGQYDSYQQIAWQFSHELVHVCSGHFEGRKDWKWLPDDHEEEILAGGIAIRIIKDLFRYCPYIYTENYTKGNLIHCEEKAESLRDSFYIT